MSCMGELGALQATVPSTWSVPHLLPSHLSDESLLSSPVASRGRAEHLHLGCSGASDCTFYVAFAYLPSLGDPPTKGGGFP